MAIRTDNFEEFGIQTSLVEINKTTFTKILASSGIDRRLLLVSVNLDDGGVELTPNSDFSHPIKISNFEVLENFLQYYNGDLYAKLSDDTTATTTNVTVWINNQ